MTNGTWVCFDCRMAQRHPTYKLVAQLQPELIGGGGNGDVRCVKCQESCLFLGPAIRIPPKLDEKAWLQLRSDVAEKRIVTHQKLYRQRVRSRHDLEQSIRELESRPESAARRKLINELKKRVGKA